jgi:hypothetical protein
VLARASLVGAVVLTVPILYEFFGTSAVAGRPWFNVGEGLGYADYLSAPNAAVPAGWLERAFGYTGPQGAPLNYVGWGLLTTLVIGVVVLRRRRVVAVTTLAGVATVLLSFGTELRARRGGPATLHVAPWLLFSHIPVLDTLTVSRLAIALGLFEAILLAVTLDAMAEAVAKRRGSVVAHASVATAVAVALGPVVAVSGLPLVTSTDGQAPGVVTSFGAHAVGTPRVLFLPYPTTPPGESAPLAWQAIAGFSYAILGGYLNVPIPGTSTSIFLEHPGGEEGALIDLASSYGATRPTDPQVAAIGSAIRHRAPTVIVVLPTITSSAWAIATITDLLGTPPSDHVGVLVWRHVHGTHALGLSVEEMAPCVGSTPPTLALARCVLDRAMRS